MPISIVLRLISERAGVLPAELGRANHALLLSRLAEKEPTLAESLHDGDSIKPITCSGIMGQRPPGNITVCAGDRAEVRCTGLTDEISAALETSFLHVAPAAWPLHGHPFHVAEVICDPVRHPWSGRQSYQELAAAGLRQAERLPRQTTLEFASPTAFHSRGALMPLPLPALVFGNLADRWNAFGGVTLATDIRQFAEEGVLLNRYSLESRPSPTKNGRTRIGAVGRAMYSLEDGAPYWAAALHILAGFALYSGVGVQTSAGMGQCRRI